MRARWSAPLTMSLIMLSMLTGLEAAAAFTSPHRLVAFTFANISRRCFYAAPPTGSGGWPFPTFSVPHAIRGGLNEPRTPMHFGVDVATSVDQNGAWTIAPGRVIAFGPVGHHLTIGTGTANYQYWHIIFARGIRLGTIVRDHTFLGWILRGYLHVHISEWHEGCGFIDPRRPTGALRDPLNTERPAIGDLTAKVANAAAFAPLQLGVDPATRHDTATPEALTALHGIVDLRASITDTPVRKPSIVKQLPLVPSAIRGWFAPAQHIGLGYGAGFHFDGSTVWGTAKLHQLHITLANLWAFGTWYQPYCYWHYGSGPCAADYVWHIGGFHGFDTRQIRNGRYLYCIQALTIHAAQSFRCTQVTVANT